jgi:hypothetical protein
MNSTETYFLQYCNTNNIICSRHEANGKDKSPDFIIDLEGVSCYVEVYCLNDGDDDKKVLRDITEGAVIVEDMNEVVHNLRKRIHTKLKNGQLRKYKSFPTILAIFDGRKTPRPLRMNWDTVIGALFGTVHQHINLSSGLAYFCAGNETERYVIFGDGGRESHGISAVLDFTRYEEKGQIVDLIHNPWAGVKIKDGILSVKTEWSMDDNRVLCAKVNAQKCEV